jgi:hypothetical protein
MLEPASGTSPRDVNGIEKLAVGEATTTSQCKSIVVPTPMAFPLTAANRGFGNSRRAPKNLATSESDSVGGFDIKSRMSFPDVK